MPVLSSETPPSGIALFDLDGTLLPWDCQLLFRHHVVRQEPWRGIFLPVFLAFLPLTGLLGAGGMKRIFLSYLWKMDPETLATCSREFAASLIPTAYPELRQRLFAPFAAGDVAKGSGLGLTISREIVRALGGEIALDNRISAGRVMGLDATVRLPLEQG